MFLARLALPSRPDPAKHKNRLKRQHIRLFTVAPVVIDRITMDKNLFSWADEVEREEEAEGRALKFELRDGWHEGLEVRRDQSKHRLDLSHGFMREIVSIDLTFVTCLVSSRNP